MPPQLMSEWLSLQLSEPLEEVVWPREIAIPGPDEGFVIFDPRNDIVTVTGASEASLGTLELDDICSRIVAVVAAGQSDLWSALKFRNEGQLKGYWPDGSSAEIWSRMTSARARVSARVASGAPPDGPDKNVPANVSAAICRVVDSDDAVAIGNLMSEAFPDYQLPTDPGVIRYALASGAVHGRGVYSSEGKLLAYASAEFQRAGGSVEITDCATVHSCRGQGLMTEVIGHLVEDLTDVFEAEHCHCFAREDQLGMQSVMAKLGWQRRGQLVNHFKVEETWLSAWVWGR